MLGQGLFFLKTLIKSSLDNYVLPGTLTGTEILLLYMNQWKRDVVLLTSATLQLISPENGKSIQQTPGDDNQTERPVADESH